MSGKIEMDKILLANKITREERNVESSLHTNISDHQTQSRKQGRSVSQKRKVEHKSMQPPSRVEQKNEKR